MASEDVWKVFSVIGILYVCKIALVLLWQLFQGLRAHVFSKLCPTNLVEKYGKWAVVTGCTSGIGRAYTFELAKRGLNVVLISRSEDKLQALANELGKTHKVQTKIIQADFTEGRRVYPRIANALKSIDVGILVNNVGIIGDELWYITEAKESYIWDEINVNIAPASMLTRILLPGMLKNRRGAIVNISSIAGGVRSIPLLAIYSASKSYISRLSNVLNEECRGSGVIVQNVVPGFVNTDLLNISKVLKDRNTLIVPSAEQYARGAVATIGIVKDTAGYWTHGIMAWGASELVPQWLWDKVSFLITRRLRKVQQPQAATEITGTLDHESNLTYLQARE